MCHHTKQKRPLSVCVVLSNGCTDDMLVPGKLKSREEAEGLPNGLQRSHTAAWAGGRTGLESGNEFDRGGI